jgi:hypothetical protein
VIVIDEYLAVVWCAATGPMVCPTTTCPLYRPAGITPCCNESMTPGSGQLSAVLARLSETGRETIRHPYPEVLRILDPRPLLDEAASIGARFRTGGLLITESLAAGLAYGQALYFGTEANVGRRLNEIATALGIAVHVLAP